MVACGVTRLGKAWQYSRWTRGIPTTRMHTDRSDEELQYTASDSRIDARYVARTATWGTCEKRILVKQLATQDSTADRSERRHVVTSWLEQGIKQQVAASTRDAGTSLESPVLAE
ncbi:hypothetical protein NL676_021038 [Syzygium grande]|nr:hypothetical protein NL676_021038 [Syzygium grande]